MRLGENSPSPECCRSCGSRLSERSVAGQATLLYYCPRMACALFGLPSVRRNGNSITFDANGDVVAESARSITETMRDAIGPNQTGR